MIVGLVVFVVAVLVTFVVSLLKNVEFSGKTKVVLATVVSLVGGVVAVLATQGWDLSVFQNADVLVTALQVFGASQLIYKFVLEGTSADVSLENTRVLPGSDS